MAKRMRSYRSETVRTKANVQKAFASFKIYLFNLRGEGYLRVIYTHRKDKDDANKKYNLDLEKET